MPCVAIAPWRSWVLKKSRVPVYLEKVVFVGSTRGSSDLFVGGRRVGVGIECHLCRSRCFGFRFLLFVGRFFADLVVEQNSHCRRQFPKIVRVQLNIHIRERAPWGGGMLVGEEEGARRTR